CFLFTPALRTPQSLSQGFTLCYVVPPFQGFERTAPCSLFTVHSRTPHSTIPFTGLHPVLCCAALSGLLTHYSLFSIHCSLRTPHSALRTLSHLFSTSYRHLSLALTVY